MANVCQMCRRHAPLTYRKDRDEYICDGCWDELPSLPPPTCKLCGLEDGACICAHIAPNIKEEEI